MIFLTSLARVNFLEAISERLFFLCLYLFPVYGSAAQSAVSHFFFIIFFCLTDGIDHDIKLAKVL